MSMRKLIERKEYLQDELYMLHFSEPSPEMYKQRRSELEYQIACLEEQIEFEEKLKPFRVTLMVFVALATLMLLYTLVVKS